MYVFLVNKCLAFELPVGYVLWQKFNMTGKPLLLIALDMQDFFKQVCHCSKLILLCAVCDSNGELQCQETQQQQLVVF